MENPATPDTPPQGALQSVAGGTGEMFDAIAGRYDLLNRILSLGQDQYWRRRAMAKLALKAGDHVLDLATGTGDLAILMARKYPGVSVEGVDPSAKMIAVGRQKRDQTPFAQRIEFHIGDGQALEHENDTFDGAIVSFGIRNFPDRLKGLSEMARVTKPGGQVVVLELSEPKHGIMALGARTYIHHIVPRIGSLLSGQKEYKYLQKSIQAFPTAQAFLELMRQAGLGDVSATPLSFGAVNLYVGQVRER